MKASDIVWGGNLNMEVKLDGEMNENLKVGSLIKFEYETSSQRYFIKFQSVRYSITPFGNANKHALEECVNRQDAIAPYLARIIDIQNHILSVKISSFYSLIKLNKLNAMKIKISEKVAERIPKKYEILEYIREKFLYLDENGDKNIFVIGISEYDRNKKSKSFTIISDDKRLTISKINNEFVAVHLGNQSTEVTAPVTIMMGEVDFVDYTKTVLITQEQVDCLNEALKGNSYLHTWEVYNALERTMLYQQAKEYGASQYESYSYEIKGSVIYKFKLKSNYFEMLTEDVELDVTEDSAIMQNAVQSDIVSSYVGQFLKLEGMDLYLVDKTGDSPKKFPKKNGYLFKSITGDKQRMRRREEAKESIATGTAPLTGLFRIINEGITSSADYQNKQPITEDVKRKLKDKNGRPIAFNEKQRQAIKIAINSPDIALIQGPPGTGKTTVIKAIIARFEEMYKKDNNGRFPRILVTSFQHEAVENAIENLDFSGLPASRMGGKRGEENRHRIELNKWIEKRSEDFDNYVANFGMPEIYKTYEQLKGSIFSWHNKNKPMDEGIEILKSAIQNSRRFVTTDLLTRIDKICASTNELSFDQLDKVVKSENEDLLNELCKQRLTPATFSDDGLKNMKNLRFDIKSGIFEIEWPDFANRVIESDGGDEKAFDEYVKFIQQLKEQYGTEAQYENFQFDVSDELNYCLNELLKQFNKSLILKAENVEEGKAKILLEYKSAINEGEAERIIEEYTDIKAATCQQAMRLGRFAENETYDLVIVDEAARANPLDLFIPLSLGRKIVLVGDHRQLPHMLDPNVVKELEAIGNDKVEIYKKSFFEILFEKLTNKEIGSPFVRTCSLTEQYRMIPEINDFVRDAIYFTKNEINSTQVDLKCGLSDEEIEIRNNTTKKYSEKALVWINLAKDRGLESSGTSKHRECEAEELMNQLKRLLNDNEKIKSVGVITFYAKQKEVLEAIKSQRLTSEEMSKVEIGTVDAFQGKEYDAVFLSCVRSNNYPKDNARKRVGFLNDENRLCVALSRGKNLLVAIGDEETVSDVEILKNYIEFCKSGRGCYLSA